MEPTRYRTLLEMADRLNGVVRDEFITGGRAHPPTLVAAAARLAGTLLFRSSGIDSTRLEPGSVMLAAPINAQIPGLERLLRATLIQLKCSIDDAAVAAAAASSTTAQAQLGLLAMQERLLPRYEKLLDASDLTPREGAHAAAIGTGLVVHTCRAALGLERAIAIAMFGFVEGAKTVPWRPDGEANATRIDRRTD